MCIGRNCVLDAIHTVGPCGTVCGRGDAASNIKTHPITPNGTTVTVSDERVNDDVLLTDWELVRGEICNVSEPYMQSVSNEQSMVGCLRDRALRAGPARLLSDLTRLVGCWRRREGRSVVSWTYYSERISERSTSLSSSLNRTTTTETLAEIRRKRERVGGEDGEGE